MRKKLCGMRDSREKGAGMRDQDPPLPDPWSLAAHSPHTSAWSLSNEFEPFFLFEGFFALAKGQGLLRVFLRRHRIDIVYKLENTQSRTSMTNLKTQTQTWENRTTPRPSRQYIFLMQIYSCDNVLTGCWQLSIRDNLWKETFFVNNFA